MSLDFIVLFDPKVLCLLYYQELWGSITPWTLVYNLFVCNTKCSTQSTSEIVSAFQEKGTFNPKKPHPLPRRWIVPASWCLIQAQKEIRVSPSTFYSWRGDSHPSAWLHSLSVTPADSTCFLHVKSQAPPESWMFPLSRHCVHSLGWLIPKCYPVCRPCCLYHLLIKLRKNNCDLFELVMN